MPKREIRAQDYRFVPLEDGAEVTEGTEFPRECRLGMLHVGWSKPGNVVEVITHDATMRQALFAPLIGTLDAVTRDPGVDQALVGALLSGVNDLRQQWPTFGVAVTLDRPGVQDAMRALKEARNAVFGRDE